MEAIGQGVESFLRPQDTDATAAPPDRLTHQPVGGAARVSNIPVSWVNGMRTANRMGGQPSPLQRATGTGGRPVGMLMYSGMLPGVPGLGGGGRSIDDIVHHLMMTESSHRSVGTLPTAIDSLERIHITENGVGATVGPCGISMDELVVGDTAIKLPCQHIYKEELIVQWLISNHTCPVCRYELPKQE